MVEQGALLDLLSPGLGHLEGGGELAGPRGDSKAVRSNVFVKVALG
jgi:hypothetical protein